MRHRPGDDVVFRHLCQTAGDAIYQALLFVGAHQAIQVARLNEIVVLGVQVRLVVARRAIGGHRGVGGHPGFNRAVEAVGLVVLGTATVVTARHDAIALVRVHGAGLRRVHRQLVGVAGEAVAVRIGVGEQPPLQHLVGRRTDARHKVGGVERRLLGLGKEVLGESVEGHHPHLAERIVGVRPHLGQVEGVEAVVLSVGERHHLHLERPGRRIAGLDGLAEVLEVHGGVRAAGCVCGSVVGDRVDALVGLPVVLHPVPIVGGVHPAVGVRPEAVHVAHRRGTPTVPVQPGELVGQLG